MKRSNTEMKIFILILLTVTVLPSPGKISDYMKQVRAEHEKKRSGEHKIKVNEMIELKAKEME